jgi:hypothetical protein
MPGLSTVTAKQLSIQQGYQLHIVGGSTSKFLVVSVNGVRDPNPYQLAKLAQLSEEVVGSLPQIKMYVGDLSRQVTYGVADMCCTHYILITSDTSLMLAMGRYLLGATPSIKFGISGYDQTHKYSVSLLPPLANGASARYETVAGRAREMCQISERATVPQETLRALKVGQRYASALAFIGQDGMCNSFGVAASDAIAAHYTYAEYLAHVSGITFPAPGHPHAFAFVQNDYELFA